MSTLPQFTKKYAWSTPYSHGPTYETREEALEIADMRDSGATLLKLYIAPDGRIVATEAVVL